MTFVGNLIFLVAIAAGGFAKDDVIVMPFVQLPPMTLAECHDLGIATYQYARATADEDGFNKIILPDDTVITVETVNYSCTPTGWIDGTAQNVDIF